MFFTTGTPVQPHDVTGLAELGVTLRWCRLPPRCFAHVGLGDAWTFDTFGKFFKLTPEPVARSSSSAGPSASGEPTEAELLFAESALFGDLDMDEEVAKSSSSLPDGIV